MIKLLIFTGLRDRFFDLGNSFVELLKSKTPKNIRSEMKTAKFYSQFINKNDLCFDIGANMGNRIQIFLKLGAIVIAVEPQPILQEKLLKKYRRNIRVVLIKKGVGEKEGEGELMICNAHTLSSMSKEWIKSVNVSGRFNTFKWERIQKIRLTTLDKMIEEYGLPTFCKIDVEGFELQVLKGLSKPIRTVSFEFTPEFITSTIKAIEHLSRIGFTEFNYSIGESMKLDMPKWVSNKEICVTLNNLTDKRIFGDVYARALI